MKWQWSLSKLAADENNPQITPQQPTQPVAAPAPVAPAPAAPQAPVVPQVGPEEQVKNFILNNYPQKQPGAETEYANIKANPNLWKLFVEMHNSMLGQKETVNEFESRIQGQIGTGTLLDSQYDKPQEAEQPVGQIAEAHDISKADRLARPKLEELAASYMQRNEDFFNAMAKSKDPKTGDIAPWAQALGEAPIEFFTGNTHGNVKKWKQFFKDHLDFLPPSVAKRAKQTKSVYEAIDMDILEATEQYEDPPILHKLEQMVEYPSPEEEKALQDAMIRTSRALADQRGQQNKSINFNVGGKNEGAQVESLTKNQKALDPAALTPKISGQDLTHCNNIWTAFIQKNPDFVEQLAKARDPQTGLVMIEALKTVNEDVKDLLEQSIHSAFSGWHEEEDAPVYNRWIDFFIQNDDLLHEDILVDPEDIQKNSGSLLPQLTELANSDDPAVKQRVQKFVFDPAFEFILKRFHERRLHQWAKLNDVIPNMTNLKTLGRLGRLASGYLRREFQFRKNNNMSSYDTPGRNYALVRAKTDAMVKDFYRLLNSNEPLKLTEDAYVYRNQNNNIILKTKEGYDRKTQQTKWAEEPLTDENFGKLASLMQVEDWVPKAFQIMRGNGKGELNQPDLLSRSEKTIAAEAKTPAGASIVPAALEYIQQNPTAPDRLLGYRQALAKVFQEKRKALAAQEGKEDLTYQEVAAKVKGIKASRGRSSGARINSSEYPTEQFIEKIDKAEPILYSEADMAVLAKALGLGNVNELFARSPEYDSYNYDDLGALGEYVPNAFRVYGPYFVHRKRESSRRMIRDDFFGEKPLWYFLRLMRVHPIFSTAVTDPKEISDKKIGKFLYQLVGKRPTGTTDTWEQVEQNLKDIPTEDIYERMGVPPSNLKRYYPNEEHPLGMEERYLKPSDIDTQMETDKLKDEQGNVQPLEYWKNRTLETLEKRKNSDKPEKLQALLEQGANPVDVAKQLIEETWGDGQAEQRFQQKLQAFNAFQAKSGGKEFSPEDYARKLVEDDINSTKYFRQEAAQRLDELQKNPPSHPSDQIKAYVPANLRRRWMQDKKKPAKPEMLSKKEVQDVAKSNKPEVIENRLNAGESPMQVAIDLIKQRNKVDDARAARILQDNMKRKNNFLARHNQDGFASLDDYAKNYVDEVVKLEKYYRDRAAKEPGKAERFSNTRVEVIYRLADNSMRKLYGIN